MLRLVFPFSRYNDGELEVKSQAIVSACTGNPNLPVVPPQFTAFDAALGDYRAALGQAATGDKADIKVKNQKRELLIAAVVAFGIFVLGHANGDEAIVTSLGFEVVREPEPLPALEKPVIIRLADGPNAGELQVLLRRVLGSKINLYQTTPDPLTAASQWTSLASTTCKATLRGLESGKKYWVRVVACGRDEQMVCSDPLSRIVQ